LWQLDLALADVVSTSSDLRLGAIRLAWWRERLDELDEGKLAAEPRLQSVCTEILPRGISGHELTQLEDAWLPLLELFPWGDPQAEGLMQRGRLLFGIGARLLGSAADEAEQAGALWSLVDGAQHCSDPQSHEMLRQRAATVLATMRRPLPRKLRVLTVLAALAAADLVREGSGLTRLSAAVRHRLMGSLPHG
jgi:15-cis-phytoene synthase